MGNLQHPYLNPHESALESLPNLPDGQVYLDVQLIEGSLRLMHPTLLPIDLLYILAAFDASLLQSDHFYLVQLLV